LDKDLRDLQTAGILVKTLVHGMSALARLIPNHCITARRDATVVCEALRLLDSSIKSEMEKTEFRKAS
jgi:hypothetical protein